MKNKFFYTMIPLLAIGDAVTTIVAITQGLGYEYNPSAAWLQASIGLNTAAILAAIYFTLAIGGAYVLSNRLKSRAVTTGLYYGVLLVLSIKAYVVISNLSIILQ